MVGPVISTLANAPALLFDSFESLRNPNTRVTVFSNPSITDAVHVEDTIVDRLFIVVHISVTDAARVAEILMPTEDNEETSRVLMLLMYTLTMQRRTWTTLVDH